MLLWSRANWKPLSCPPRPLIPLTYPCRLHLCDFCSEQARESHWLRTGSCPALLGLQRWAVGATSLSPLLLSMDEHSSLCTSLLLLPQTVAEVSPWLPFLGPAAGGLCSNTGSAGLAQWQNKGPLAGDLSLFSPISFSDAFISSEQNAAERRTVWLWLLPWSWGLGCHWLLLHLGQWFQRGHHPAPPLEIICLLKRLAQAISTDLRSLNLRGSQLCLA